VLNSVLLFQSNVLAPYAEAIINHRIHPSQTAAEVILKIFIVSFCVHVYTMIQLSKAL